MAAVITAALVPIGSSPARADGPCATGVGILYVAAQCDTNGQPGTSSDSSPGAASAVTYTQVCADAAAPTCQPATCQTVDGAEGVMYAVTGSAGSAQSCLFPDDAAPSADPTPGAVAAAFRRLSWPASELVIQPPNGRTAVNLDTYFFTPDTAPLTRTVRLLGQRVTIEATPSTFGWRWGDGGSASTTSPGAAYPHGDVVHRYLRTGSVSPSLATTYTGRYRLGDGPWQAIPGTHTVTGPAQDLEVVEVRPTLVSSDS